MKRSSGVLLPIFSLPSCGCIGTLGKAAYQFVDFLAAAGQHWWQMLPVGPTGYGNSPYQSFSSYAGNPYFIDLEQLVAEDALPLAALKQLCAAASPSVDYAWLYAQQHSVLALSMDLSWDRFSDEIAQFTQDNQDWLPDYALFMALKQHFAMKPWYEWEDISIRRREKAALAHYQRLLGREIQLYTYIQFLFFRQFHALHAYAASREIELIGDLPIYVAMDSADVWACPEYFELDEQFHPTVVAGVPPDYFCEDGQLWGNPLYRWDRMEQEDFAWYLRRIAGSTKLFDALRIDHFRGLESYWAVPAGDDTARNGTWQNGPGMKLISAMHKQFPHTQFIAEDLGFLTPEVHTLLEQSTFPGMKVLEFAFDSRESADYSPASYPSNSVCYTGTHDNVPLMGWLSEAAAEDVALAQESLGETGGEPFAWAMLELGASSNSNVFIAQIQDYLRLGADSRINTPGTFGDNWCWRLKDGQLTPQLAAKMKALAKKYDRIV